MVACLDDRGGRDWAVSGSAGGPLGVGVAEDEWLARGLVGKSLCAGRERGGSVSRWRGVVVAVVVLAVLAAAFLAVDRRLGRPRARSTLTVIVAGRRVRFAKGTTVARAAALLGLRPR